MAKIILTFVTLYQSSVLNFNTEFTPWQEMLLLFDKTPDKERDGYLLKAVQQRTPEFVKSFSEFTIKHKADYPQINQLNGYFKKLPENCLFIIHNGTLANTALFNSYFAHLRKQHEQRDIPVLYNIIDIDFGKLFEIYNMELFGFQIKGIGVKDKAKRICRFCYCKQNELNRFGKTVSFKNKAHAYSAALGNKKVILYEECDACNNRFSTGIEPSLITFLSVFRSIYGLKGNNGYKTLTGNNFTLKSDSKTIDLVYDGEIENLIPDETSKKIEMMLHLKDKIVGQDVYRCLSKFILSVLDKNSLIYFEKTLSWVNGELDAKDLPEVALLEDPNFFKDEPILAYYKRKNDQSHYPFVVGELQYAYLVFVFIVPFSNNDDLCFVDRQEYEYFWKDYNQVRSNKNWKFISLSAKEKSDILINFSIDIPAVQASTIEYD